ncbi:hypothetical protein I204_07383 [Kwoniella mangroviensis CBS 8886]|nr:hypothetical protein I204_07383 [Kwoniella mangroviensis CBS 8886]
MGPPPTSAPGTTATDEQDVSPTLDILAGRVGLDVDTDEASLVIDAYNAVSLLTKCRTSNQTEIRLNITEVNKLTKYLGDTEGRISETANEFFRGQLDILLDLQNTCSEEEQDLRKLTRTIRDRQLEVLSTPRSEILSVAPRPQPKKTPTPRAKAAKATANARKAKETPAEQEEQPEEESQERPEDQSVEQPAQDSPIQQNTLGSTGAGSNKTNKKQMSNATGDESEEHVDSQSSPDDRSTPKSKKRKTAPAAATRGGGRKRNTALGPRTRSRDLETGV